MRFAHPFALLLALPTLVWFCWFTGQLRRTAARPRLLWRAATAVFLMLAAGGLQIAMAGAPITVVFALDRSSSMPAVEQRRAVAHVNDLTSTMRPGDRLGVVAFGADAAIELRPSERPRLQRIQSTVASAGTDIANAIRLAGAALPAAGDRRIVLMSDGRETSGDAEDEALRAAAAGVQIDVIPVHAGAAGPVHVTRVVAPPESRLGEPYLVSVEVTGGPNARGRVAILRDGELLETPEVIVGSDGTGSVALTERQDAERAYVYQASAVRDDEPDELGAAGAVVLVAGTPTLLYVSSAPPTLARELGAAGFRLTSVEPEQVPRTVEALSGFAGVVLDDVPSDRLVTASMDALAAYVETEGGGLLLLGGSRSLQLDGYPTTPLERIVPIDLRPRGGQRAPSMKLAIVFDKSGSMADVSDGVPKIEMARQAVMRTLDVMPPGDSVGVIAFDSKPAIVMPLGPGRDPQALRAALENIRPSGSTLVAPAVEAALQWFGRAGQGTVTERQVLLISDGRTTAEDAERTKELARSGIARISVVATGPTSNRPLLEEIARISGGRAYFPDTLRELPQTVAREAVRSSAGNVVQEPFTPRAGMHPVLAGIDRAALPLLQGYVVSAAKATASPIITSPLDDPVLCVWSAGLGRVAVYTADLGSSWSARMAAWKDGPRLWAQTVRWLSRRGTDPALQVALRETDAGPQLQVEAYGPDGTPLDFDIVGAVLRSPGGVGNNIELEETAPGRYEARMPPSSAGAYLLTVAGRDRGTQAEHRVVRALYRSADREGQPGPTDTAMLGRLAALTRGRVLADTDSPFRERPVLGYRDMSRWVAAAALCMFLIELAVGGLFGAKRLRLTWRRHGRDVLNRVAM